jgi:hypothetical protein
LDRTFDEERILNFPGIFVREGWRRDGISGKKDSSRVLLIGGAGLTILVCLASVVLVGALVILPILKPDSPNKAGNPNSSRAGDSVEFPSSGEGPSFSPNSEDADLRTGRATVEIVNNYSDLVCFINISPSEEERWGENWLEEGETLSPSSTKTFYIEAGFLYDWLVQDCDGTILVEEYEQYIQDGLNILTIDP